MSVQAGRPPPGDRHPPRSLTGDQLGRFVSLARTYAPHLYDYCQELLRDPAASAEVVEDTLAAAAAHFGAAQSEPPRSPSSHSRSGYGRAGPAAPADPESGEDDQFGRGQDSDRIRPWLYATARHECLNRQLVLGRSGPVRPGEMVPAGPAGYRSAPGSPYAEEAVEEALTAEFAVSDLEAEERRRHAVVVTGVLSGLSDGTGEILSLAFRHGLGASDLGAVLGVSPRRARTRLSKAREQFARLAATVVLLHAGWSGCRRLDRMVNGSYPTSPPPGDRLCRRVFRHSKSCVTCGPIVASRGFGPALLSVLPIGDLPPGLEQRLISGAQGPRGPLPGSAVSADQPEDHDSGPGSSAGDSPDPGGPPWSVLPASAVPAGAGSAVPSPPLPGPPLPGPALPGPAMPGPALPGPALPSPAMPSPAMTGPALPDPAMAGLSGPGLPGSDPYGPADPADFAAAAGRAGGPRFADTVDDRLSDPEDPDDRPGYGAAFGAAGLAGAPESDAAGAAESFEPGSAPPKGWLTRPRAAVASAVAVLVIAGLAVAAGRLVSSSDGGSSGPHSTVSTRVPGTQPSSGSESGSADPSHRASDPSRPGRPSASAPVPGNSGPAATGHPSGSVSSKPSTKPTPKPSSHKPSPSPSPTPTTTSPSPSPDPTPTTSTPAPATS